MLLSGGLDSATVLAIARAEGFACRAISFLYGQRHAIELQAARAVAASIGVVEHRTISIDLRQFGGSALTGTDAVPKDRELTAGGIPITYVPARNALFLTYALAWAEVCGARDLFIGVNAVDYSGYPDCRPEFIRAFEHMANVGTRAGAQGERYRIHAPLLELSKARIIERGMALNVDFALTRSCYDPHESGLACGHCDSCQLRQRGFAELGLRDPAPYVGTRSVPPHDAR